MHLQTKGLFDATQHKLTKYINVKMFSITVSINCLVLLCIISSTVLSIEVISTSIECNEDFKIAAIYLLKNKNGAVLKSQVAACSPSFDNHYCRSKRTVWTKQECIEEPLGTTKIAIFCQVTPPYQGDKTAYKAFGLQITIFNIVSKTRIVRMRPITPVLVCDIENKKHNQKKIFRTAVHK